MQELKVGTLLQGGKYRIVNKLGQGGFGITYMAITKGSLSGSLGGMSVDVPVVIKEFFMEDFCVRAEGDTRVHVTSTTMRGQTERYRQKFIKEARNISAMSHPNIVQVMDVFEENDTVYYVMQYLEGGTLRQMMDNQGRIPEEQALKYIHDIANALSYMHQKRHMCHLDVKPSNIMLNGEGRAMLIDFGISKNYTDDGNETSNTLLGLSKGYAPMEQYQNLLHDFSPVTDIYSLGATLLALLTGKVPPEAAIVNEDGLGEKPEYISAQTWKAISAAMQPKRRERPQTIDAFLSIIDNPQEQTNQQANLDETIRINDSERFSEETRIIDNHNMGMTPPPYNFPEGNPQNIPGQQPPYFPDNSHEISNPFPPKKNNSWVFIVVFLVAAIFSGIIYTVFKSSSEGQASSDRVSIVDTLATDTLAVDTFVSDVEPAPVVEPAPNKKESAPKAPAKTSQSKSAKQSTRNSSSQNGNRTDSRRNQSHSRPSSNNNSNHYSDGDIILE